MDRTWRKVVRKLGNTHCFNKFQQAQIYIQVNKQNQHDESTSYNTLK